MCAASVSYSLTVPYRCDGICASGKTRALSGAEWARPLRTEQSLTLERSARNSCSRSISDAADVEDAPLAEQ